MTNTFKRAAASALALSLGFGLAACSGYQENANYSLNSVNQPVVERANYALDLSTNPSGLSVPEQQRLVGWFDMLNLRYGDAISIDDPSGNRAVREDVAAVASRYGLLLAEGLPVTEGYVDPGMARVVVTRSIAYVPGCPTWSDEYGFQQGNATSDGFGCAVNSNMAAKVANPEHLLEGAHGTGETVVMTSNRAINTYREAQPTGANGLPQVSSQEGGN